MQKRFLVLFLVSAALSGCGDAPVNRATIGFVFMMGRGGSWPYLIELGDSAAMYSEALASGLAGPVIAFNSVRRPARFDWHSSDPSVLAVNDRGVVRALKLGEAGIWTVVDSVTSSDWRLRVIPRGVARLHIDDLQRPATDRTLRLRVTALDEEGRSIADVPLHATWMLPDRGQTVHCALAPENLTPCDLVLTVPHSDSPVRLKVMVPTLYGREDRIEAEIVLPLPITN